MPNGRMISHLVTDSDRFLDMTVSGRLLYYELVLHADDDGFVSSPKRLVRAVDCAEDELNLLEHNGYIIRFESGVLVIVHWLIHNKIKRDRYHPTIHRHEYSMLKIEENGTYSLAVSADGTSLSHARDRDVSEETKNKLSKVKKDKEDLSAEADAGDSSLYSEVVGLFNNICTSLPKVKLITDKRKAAIRSARKLLGDASFEELFKTAEASDFLSGRSENWTGCGFDWLLTKANLTKVLEGTYNNRRAKPVRNYEEEF